MLGSLLDHAWRWSRRHPLIVDALTALPWCLVCVLVQPVEQISTVQLLGWLAVIAATGLALALRSTRPRAAVAVLAVACVAHILILDSYTAVAAVAALWAAYLSQARLGRPLRRWAMLALLAGTLWAAIDYSRDIIDLPWWQRFPVLIVEWLAVGFFALLGALARKRGEETEALRRSQAQELRLATLGERTHIAREMHDIVAHSLGVIIAQADGGRYAAAASPGAAVRSLETIGEVGRESLAEMRELLHVLRSDDSRDTLPAPGPGDLPALFDDYRRAGLDLTTRIDDLSLAPAAGLVVYRIVQESLTNVLKHAGRVGADVAIDRAADGVRVVVTNPLPAQLPAADAGHGLIGMRERVDMRGGTLSAGAADGVWRVTARLPLRDDESAGGTGMKVVV
ncbi:sensor histidine kinase [Mariniluteicoccus endophyticus]